MAQTLCYLPAEKIPDPMLWTSLRSWQKARNLSAEKIRWTPDFLQAEGIDREQLAGALALLRGGHIHKVVYFEPRARAEKDLDWLAFACKLYPARHSSRGRTGRATSHQRKGGSSSGALHDDSRRKAVACTHEDIRRPRPQIHSYQAKPNKKALPADI